MMPSISSTLRQATPAFGSNKGFRRNKSAPRLDAALSKLKPDINAPELSNSQKKWGFRLLSFLSLGVGGIGGAALSSTIYDSPDHYQPTQALVREARTLSDIQTLPQATNGGEMVLPQALQESLSKSNQLIFDTILAQDAETGYRAIWPEVSDAIDRMLADPEQHENLVPLLESYQALAEQAVKGNASDLSDSANKALPQALSAYASTLIKTAHDNDPALARQLASLGISQQELSTDADKQVEQLFVQSASAEIAGFIVMFLGYIPGYAGYSALQDQAKKYKKLAKAENA